MSARIRVCTCIRVCTRVRVCARMCVCVCALVCTAGIARPPFLFSYSERRCTAARRPGPRRDDRSARVSSSDDIGQLIFGYHVAKLSGTHGPEKIEDNVTRNVTFPSHETPPRYRRRIICTPPSLHGFVRPLKISRNLQYFNPPAYKNFFFFFPPGKFIPDPSRRRVAKVSILRLKFFFF